MTFYNTDWFSCVRIVWIKGTGIEKRENFIVCIQQFKERGFSLTGRALVLQKARDSGSSPLYPIFGHIDNEAKRLEYCMAFTTVAGIHKQKRKNPKDISLSKL